MISVQRNKFKHVHAGAAVIPPPRKLRFESDGALSLLFDG